MFFTQSFMTRISFYKLFLIDENKNIVTDSFYKNNDYANVIKFMKIISSSTQNRQERQKSTER